MNQKQQTKKNQNQTENRKPKIQSGRKTKFIKYYQIIKFILKHSL